MTTRWRIEEQSRPWSMGVAGSTGYRAVLIFTGAVPRGGHEVEMGTFASVEDAERARDAAEAGEEPDLFALLIGLENMGITPDEAEVIMRHAEGRGLPALENLACPYRIGATPTRERAGMSGREIGRYLGWTILWWPKYGPDGVALHKREWAHVEPPWPPEGFVWHRG